MPLDMYRAENRESPAANHPASDRKRPLFVTSRNEFFLPAGRLETTYFDGLFLMATISTRLIKAYSIGRMRLDADRRYGGHLSRYDWPRLALTIQR